MMTVSVCSDCISVIAELSDVTKILITDISLSPLLLLQETGEDTNVVKAKHARTKDYTCTVCEKSYSSKGWLENHMASKHLAESTSQSSKCKSQMSMKYGSLTLN